MARHKAQYCFVDEATGEEYKADQSPVSASAREFDHRSCEATTIKEAKENQQWHEKQARGYSHLALAIKQDQDDSRDRGRETHRRGHDGRQRRDCFRDWHVKHPRDWRGSRDLSPSDWKRQQRRLGVVVLRQIANSWQEPQPLTVSALGTS